MAGTTDTIPAKLTPGEFVIKREAVDMIGVPFLNKLNNMPDEGGGHTEIDKLISMASMEGMKNMYGGGMVEMMGGGMVKNKMMGYGHGGMVKSPIMGMQKGGMAKNLKPVPDDNPGLGKLPEMVRNRMGYMQDGGMVDDSLMGMMKGGMAKKKKGYGYQDGGPVSPEVYASTIRKLVDKLGGAEPEGMYTPEGGLTREGYAKMLGASPESIAIDTLSFQNPANFVFKVSGKGANTGVDVGGTTRSSGQLPLKSKVLDPLMREKIQNPFERLDFDVLFSKIKPMGYQEGGMVGPPAPQRNEIMQPGQVPPGTVMGPSDADIEQLRMLRAMELKNSIQDSTVQKARDTKKLMGLLDSLRNNPQDIDILDNPDTLEGSPFLDDNTIYLKKPSRGEMINKMMQMGYI
tara:strand:- start:9951 stop:11159 length:1209 start_codon:yes stop_codon:yes gene_type:complete